MPLCNIKIELLITVIKAAINSSELKLKNNWY